MSVYLNEEMNRNGDVVKTTFLPSSDMLRFAMARASLKNSNLDDKAICKQVGVSVQRLNLWRQEYNPHFEEWLCKALENFQAPVREALFAFGVDKAFQGDFQYWKEVSRTVGAISAEKVEITSVTSKTVEELASMSPEQLKQEQEKMLSELIGIRTGNAANPVAKALEGEEPASGSSGDSQVSAGSLVLSHPLASD